MSQITKNCKIYFVNANGVSKVVATQKQGDKLVENLAEFGVTANVTSEIHEVKMEIGAVVAKED